MTDLTFSQEEIDQAVRDRAYLVALQNARKTRKMDGFFLATGPFRRDLYEKHLAFFRAGGLHRPMDICPPNCDGDPHRERAALAGNRAGKTVMACFETVCHATGIYPSWWEGLRFTEPCRIWVANDTNKNTRDVNQFELLGAPGNYGTGMIPADLLKETKIKQGIADAIEFIYIKHITGGLSSIQFKSYEQGWEAFTGAAIHLAWLDEEPPLKIYVECCMRTMTTKGHVLLTFTPLQGATELVTSYLNSYKEAAGKVASDIDTQSQVPLSPADDINTQAPLPENAEKKVRIDPRIKRPQ